MNYIEDLFDCELFAMYHLSTSVDVRVKLSEGIGWGLENGNVMNIRLTLRSYMSKQ